MAIWLPHYERVEGIKKGWEYKTPGPYRLVLHTTETDGLGSMPKEHKSPPQLWVDLNKDKYIQSIPLDQAAFALEHLSGTVDTNGLFCVQVEIVARAKDTHSYSDEWYQKLARRVISPVCEAVGIDYHQYRPFMEQSSKKTMSEQEWREFKGVCGHQHVPHNDHWDPGKLDYEKVIKILDSDHTANHRNESAPDTGSRERKFVACKTEVFNRGAASEAFLNELVDWCQQAPDEIFARNDRFDIYSHVSDTLGSGDNLLHRKAIMLEVLRVLAGFESSWKWTEGRDTTNPDSNTTCTEEAGIFQCSGNSMNFDSSLKDLLRAVSGQTDCETFKSVSKGNHRFAIEYCARLLRFTINHHGPLKRKEIHPWLKREAVNEFKACLLG